MLKILTSEKSKTLLCDGVSRRDFLKIGGLGLGGLSLSQLLQLESQAGIRKSQKAVIMIYLVGGPPHQDMYDLKPDAPDEVAGPHKPIKTNVAGAEICELFPQQARIMDKLTVIRSLVGAQADHDAFQCYTGRFNRKNGPAGGWPQFGSAAAKVLDHKDKSVPPFASLAYTTTHGPYNEPGPGFLGVAGSPMPIMGTGREDLVLQGITADRLGDRRSLLAGVDRVRRDIDATSKMTGMDAFTDQAMNILTSSRLVDALDLTKEDPRVVARYGTGDEKVFLDGNGAPRVPQSMLLARRLVEAGCRIVTLNYSKWDWHGGSYNTIFNREREDFPVYDNAITALVEDLHERGLDKDVTVLVWGEFGRTPIISKQVGRDHWPRVAMALMAGGGMRNGQVIGATDRLGGEAVQRPVKFADVFATLYHNLGIDTRATTIADLNGRPQYLVEDGAQAIRELI